MYDNSLNAAHANLRPPAWKEVLLTDVVDFIHGKAYEPFVEEFGRYILVNSRFISTNGQVSKRTNFDMLIAKRHDVLTVLSDLPNGRALAKTFLVKENDLYAVNQRICIWRPKTSAWGAYLYYAMNRHKHFLSLDDGVSQTHILNKHILTCSLTYPPLEEQQAIAEVLSDVDELIAQTEVLIAKKEAIKMGVMQELLRPKEGWDNAQIGELGTTFGGLSGKSKEDFVSGTHRYVPFMNVMANTIVNIDHLEYVRIGIHEKQNVVKAGDLLFNGSSETPEELGMCSLMYQDVSDLYLNSFCFGFRLNNPKKIDALFLTYLFRSNYGRALIYSSAQGATRYNLSKRNFLGLSISFPSIEVQQAIVEVLSEVDAELRLMRDLSFKYEQLKSAMRNQLLTGKTRLV